MPRLMSVAVTEAAVVARTKTETRRLGWATLPPGVDLDLCHKVMGRRRPDGTVEPLVRLARVHVTSVGWERLDAITQASVDREGVEGVTTPAAFVDFYCRAFKVAPEATLTVIRWEYLAAPAAWCVCEPCPGRGTDGHGMTHCAECCFGTGVTVDLGCPVHGPGAWR